MTKHALFSIITCTFLSSQLMAQTGKIDSTGYRTLRIDPDAARGASVSQIFDEVKFIPLETTKESMFGSISQLRVTDDRYIIWDYDTKSILIFTKDGKYKAKINGSKIEKDPSSKQSQEFWGFTLRNENNNPVIQVSTGKNIHYFDIDGNLIRKEKYEEGKVYGYQRQFSDGTIVDQGYMEKQDKDSIYYEVSLVKDKKKIAGYFPYSQKRYKDDQFYSGGESVTDYGVRDELFFVNYYDYNIYRLTPAKLSLSYRLIFPVNNSLPPDFKDNPVYKGKRAEYFEKNPKVFFAIGNPYLIGDNLYLKGSNWSWGANSRKAFIYNLKSNLITSISDIEPDTLSQFLPVTDAGMHYDFANKGFLLFDKTYFYTSYSSLALFSFKEQNEGKNRVYDPVLSNYFKTQNKKSNPVIIQLKPKKN
ncbi:6-bladed beta-propeller [Pedobacter sp. JY14-1]|uniref:6-bladed beta-propeller n=1 Tax=Pedobacter sp. JY14-1 TaxID=3034151 RepID=UPI0023E273C9|nr:6-bladed beta-propeller [Pedobacter sp. JY14-1]